MGLTNIVENDPKKFAIWFRKFKTTDIYICSSDTTNMKESWKQVIQDVLEVQSQQQARPSGEVYRFLYGLTFSFIVLPNIQEPRDVFDIKYLQKISNQYVFRNFKMALAKGCTQSKGK